MYLLKRMCKSSFMWELFFLYEIYWFNLCKLQFYAFDNLSCEKIGDQYLGLLLMIVSSIIEQVYMPLKVPMSLIKPKKKNPNVSLWLKFVLNFFFEKKIRAYYLLIIRCTFFTCFCLVGKHNLIPWTLH